MLENIVKNMTKDSGIDVHKLPAGTRLVIRTNNSNYIIEKTDFGGECVIQGGKFFPNPTPATFVGSTVGGSCIWLGWVGHRLYMEVAWRHDDGRRGVLTTSSVMTAKIIGSSWEYEMEWQNQ